MEVLWISLQVFLLLATPIYVWLIVTELKRRWHKMFVIMWAIVFWIYTLEGLLNGK